MPPLGIASILFEYVASRCVAAVFLHDWITPRTLIKKPFIKTRWGNIANFLRFLAWVKLQPCVFVDGRRAKQYKHEVNIDN